MNLYNEIFRIKELRYAIRDKLISMGLLEASAIYEPGQQERAISGGDLEACKNAIYLISGNQNIINNNRYNVNNKKTVKIVDNNLKNYNIRKNVTILGVTGTFEGTNQVLPLDTPTWNYDTSAAPTTIIPSSSYNGFEKVYTSIGFQDVLKEEYIVKGKKIMGVDGNYNYSKMPQYYGNSYYSENNNHHSLIFNTDILFPIKNVLSKENILEGFVYRYTGTSLIYPFAFKTERWSVPDTSFYYIYNMKFGKNIYDNNNKFLSMDVYKKNNADETIYYHIRVFNDTPYYSYNYTTTIDGSSYTFPVLHIDLSDKQFKLANSHEEYVGDILNWSNMVRFDTTFHQGIDWYTGDKYYDLHIVTT